MTTQKRNEIQAELIRRFVAHGLGTELDWCRRFAESFAKHFPPVVEITELDQIDKYLDELWYKTVVR